jgi:tetratricopeptide (TPR) repeat protein
MAVMDQRNRLPVTLAAIAIVLSSAPARADGPAEDSKALVAQAEDRLEKKKFDAAIADCNEAIRLDPGLLDAYETRGRAWGMKGKFDRALADFDRAILIDGGQAALHRNRCWAHASLGQIESALADLSRAIAIDSEDASTFQLRAFLRHGKGDLDGAIADYTEAIRLDPTDIRSFCNRGRIWMQKHDVTRALADFDKCIHLAPDNPIGYLNRGDCRRSARDFDRAIADCDETIRLDPKLALAYTNRGNCWRAKEEFDRAIADFDEAIRLDPIAARSVAGFPVKYEMESPRDASGEPYMKNARATALVERGNCRVKTGRYAEALADFDEALRLNPEFVGPVVERAWLWAGCPDPNFRDGPNAVESARRACETIRWRKSYVLGALAAAQAETGDFAAAIATEEKAMPLYEDEFNRTAAQARLTSYRARRPYRMGVYPGRPAAVAAREPPPHRLR